MVDSYENLKGKIWIDGELVEWQDAKFHLLTHALHYGSSVFEGERAYGGKIYKSYEHSVRLRSPQNMLIWKSLTVLMNLKEPKIKFLTQIDKKMLMYGLSHGGGLVPIWAWHLLETPSGSQWRHGNGELTMETPK